MYSSSDYERLFIRYKAETVPQGKSIQNFCFKIKYLTISFTNGIRIRDICWFLFRSKTVRIWNLSCGFRYSGSPEKYGTVSFEDNDRHLYEQRDAYTAAEPKLSKSEKFGVETGGAMLSIIGMTRFYYLRNFHYLRCENSRVFSI